MRKAALQAKGIIKADFDVNGFENFLPTKSYRNRQKSNFIQNDEALIFYLGQAEKSREKAERLHASAVASDYALKNWLEIKAHAETNNATIEDVVGYLRYQTEGEALLRVPPEVDGEAVFHANSQFAATLMDKPFALGKGSITEVELRTDDGRIAVCRTANEYLAAKDAGHWPLTQFDITVCGMADQTSELLRAVRDAKYAVNSEIRAPQITLMNLDRWASSWVTEKWQGMADPVEDISRFPTIASLIDAGLAKASEHTQWEVVVDSDHGLSVMLRELMRGDLDGDSQEEILVYDLTFARGGTLRAGVVRHAKLGPDNLLAPIDIDNRGKAD